MPSGSNSGSARTAPSIHSPNTSTATSVPRSHFNELAREGKVRHWREAFQSGTVKATGPAEIL